MNKRLTIHAARMRLQSINDRLSILERAARKRTTEAAKATAAQNLKEFWTQVATDRTLIKNARLLRCPAPYQRDKQREQRRRREQLRRERTPETSSAELPTLYGVDLLGPA